MLCLQKPKSLSLPRRCVHWRGDPFPKRTEPAFAPACTSYCQNQEEISAKKIPPQMRWDFGGDCWTRTSDLLRVKIRCAPESVVPQRFPALLRAFGSVGHPLCPPDTARSFLHLGHGLGQALRRCRNDHAVIKEYLYPQRIPVSSGTFETGMCHAFIRVDSGQGSERRSARSCVEAGLHHTTVEATARRVLTGLTHGDELAACGGLVHRLRRYRRRRASCRGRTPRPWRAGRRWSRRPRCRPRTDPPSAYREMRNGQEDDHAKG